MGGLLHAKVLVVDVEHGQAAAALMHRPIDS